MSEVGKQETLKAKFTRFANKNRFSLQASGFLTGILGSSFGMIAAVGISNPALAAAAGGLAVGLGVVFATSALDLDYFLSASESNKKLVKQLTTVFTVGATFGAVASGSQSLNNRTIKIENERVSALPLVDGNQPLPALAPTLRQVACEGTDQDYASYVLDGKEVRVACKPAP